MLVSSTATYFDVTLVNGGPLTSTFTPPPSCVTPTNHNIELIGSHGTGNWQTDCKHDTTKKRVSYCVPSESSWVNAPMSDYSKDDYELTYYSPGLACPSGYVTSGIAVVGKGSSTSTSGEAFLTKSPWTLDDYQPLPYASYFVDNPEVSETAIFCCPSGFKMDYLGGCSSTVGKPADFGYTEACRGGYTVISEGKNVTELHGRTYRPPLQLPATLGDYTVMNSVPLPLPTTSGETAIITESAVVSYRSVLIIVKKDSDGEAKDGEESAAAVSRSSLGTVTAAMAVAACFGAVLML